MTKRLVAIALLIILCVCFCACGKSEEAVIADELILSIGNVSLESENKIQEAETAVKALDEEERKSLGHLEVLEAAKTAFEDLEAEEESKHLVEIIEKIGEVTSLEQADTIVYARTLYNRASTKAKENVTNYEKLKKAEDNIRTLKLQFISDAIDQIGTVTLDDADLIFEARSIYNSLSSEDRKNFPDGDKLIDAYVKVNELRELDKEKEREQILASFRNETDKVEQVTWYMPYAYPQYANARSFVLPYLGVREYSVWLRLQYHYTGSDWIFFDTITIVVDGQRYDYIYDYFDVKRDNSGGSVWEWIDVSPTDEEIEMLKAMGNSEETIIRFQGDTYHYDLTLSDSDKKAINSVLEAYESLS